MIISILLDGMILILTLYHTIPTFNDPEEEEFLKTLREKEQMLATSISSFFHNISTFPKTNFSC